MIERDAFLKALEENEDDTTTRLIYADWLEEQGEDDEAQRQRQWPAAKKWLVDLCTEANHHEYEGNGTYYVTYSDLIKKGRATISSDYGPRGYFFCVNSMKLLYLLQEYSEEFWKNWSIITGIPLSKEQQEKMVLLPTNREGLILESFCRSL